MGVLSPFSPSRKVCEIKKHLKRLSNRISSCSVEMMECQDCLQGVGVPGVLLSPLQAPGAPGGFLTPLLWFFVTDPSWRWCFVLLCEQGVGKPLAKALLVPRIACPASVLSMPPPCLFPALSQVFFPGLFPSFSHWKVFFFFFPVFSHPSPIPIPSWCHQGFPCCQPSPVLPGMGGSVPNK